jgi:hypothetical protein
MKRSDCVLDIATAIVQQGKIGRIPNWDEAQKYSEAALSKMEELGMLPPPHSKEQVTRDLIYYYPYNSKPDLIFPDDLWESEVTDG